MHDICAEEFAAIWKFMAFSIFLYVLFGGAISFVTDMWWRQVLANTLVAFVFTGFGLIQTVYVLKKLGINELAEKQLDTSHILQELEEKQIEKLRDKLFKITASEATDGLMANSGSHNSSIVVSGDDKDGEYVSQTFVRDVGLLSEILSDYDKYGCFMQYLAKGFTTECLLSLTEFVQFKQYLVSNFISLKERLLKELEAAREADNMTTPAVRSGQLPVCASDINMCNVMESK